MPVSAVINRSERVVITTAVGRLVKSEFIEHIRSVWTDPGLAGFDELIDATRADASQLSAKDLSDLVNSGVSHDATRNSRLALCVSSELAYGLGRMYGALRETHAGNAREVQVFRDLEAAQAWLEGGRGD